MKDRTIASVNDVHQYLIHKYNIELVKLEMATHHARQTRMNSKLQRYFNSTPIRHAFARWMVYASYNYRTYTIQQLVDEIGSNRQTISDIVKDCEAEGWITVDRRDNTASCRGTSILVEKYEEYCDYRRTLVNNVSGEAFTDLGNFERTMSIGFALNEHHNANSIGVDNVSKPVK